MEPFTIRSDPDSIQVGLSGDNQPPSGARDFLLYHLPCFLRGYTKAFSFFWIRKRPRRAIATDFLSSTVESGTGSQPAALPRPCFCAKGQVGLTISTCLTGGKQKPTFSRGEESWRYVTAQLSKGILGYTVSLLQEYSACSTGFNLTVALL